MKTLAAGSTKFLLLDLATIKRNSERSKVGSPIVVVAEVDDKGVVTKHVGYALRVVGAVDLAYDQRGAAVQIGRDRHPAAFSTIGEVRLAEYAGEILVAVEEPAPLPAPVEEVVTVVDETRAETKADAEVVTETPPADAGTGKSNKKAPK